MTLSNALTGVDALNALEDARNSLTDTMDDGLLTQARRAICDAAATTPGQIAAIYSPVASGIGAFCQPYYDQNGDEPPSLEEPFQGGQCPGTRYEVTTTRSWTGGEVVPRVENVFGPITSIVYSPQTFTKTETIPITLTVTGANGTFTQTNNLAVQSGSLSPLIRRTGGAVEPPGGCGNPPPTEPVPSPGYSRPRPVGTGTPIIVNGDTVNVTVGPQQIDLSNNPYVVVDIGGVEIPVSLTNPAADPVLPSPPQPPTRPGTPTDSPAPSGTADDEPTPEEESNGVETIGYAWNFPETPSQQPPIPGTNPGRFPVIVGNLQLRYRNSEGQTFWSENYIIREQSGSLIRPDESLVVTGVSWQKNPLWPRIVLTPLKRQKVNNA